MEPVMSQNIPLKPPPGGRRIVQITSCADDSGGITLFAFCHDSSVWACHPGESTEWWMAVESPYDLQ